MTRATATHAYPDYRREPYIAKLTVSADSEVGEVEASAEFYVFVREQVGFVVGGFDLGDNFKTAVRGLTGFVQALTVIVIWLAIFSPFWGAIVALVWFIVRRRARRRTESRERLAAEGTATGRRDRMTTRHFTATAFVVRGDSVALHWHPKVKAWLPPGGHIEPNEDPVQAVLRETKEETGIEAEVVPTSVILNLAYPEQVQPPYTIMIEDIHDPVDGFHNHIDMIYFCRPVTASNPLAERMAMGVERRTRGPAPADEWCTAAGATTG